MRVFRNPTSGLDAILNRPPETSWDRLVASPITTIARYLSTFFPVSFPIVPREDDAVTVVCISDTHNTRPRLPPGDILVHAGDLTVSGTRAELKETVDWIKAQEHRFKVVVAGNHDLCLDERLREGEEEGEVDWGYVVYLDCSSATLKVPPVGNWAFQYPRSGPLDPWAGRVPAGTDVLVTHAPPKGHMDDPRGNWGCEMLLRELWRVRPRLHVFGHVHCGHGVEAVGFDEVQGAWEDVVLDVSKGGRGFMAFARMVRACIGVWWRGGRRGRGATVLVNAAVVGGLGDRLVREAAVVRI
ncbi:hypothetical protein K456DRAFT_1745983 [Colletotrichum gloeosporioides 23]|nr:hypothetical protein K456DRAFT_1745983 [Colletotrichum gloeosporioides 23]